MEGIILGNINPASLSVSRLRVMMRQLKTRLNSLGTNRTGQQNQKVARNIFIDGAENFPINVSQSSMNSLEEKGLAGKSRPEGLIPGSADIPSISKAAEAAGLFSPPLPISVGNRRKKSSTTTNGTKRPSAQVEESEESLVPGIIDQSSVLSEYSSGRANTTLGKMLAKTAIIQGQNNNSSLDDGSVVSDIASVDQQSIASHDRTIDSNGLRRSKQSPSLSRISRGTTNNSSAISATNKQPAKTPSRSLPAPAPIATPSTCSLSRQPSTRSSASITTAVKGPSAVANSSASKSSVGLNAKSPAKTPSTSRSMPVRSRSQTINDDNVSVVSASSVRSSGTIQSNARSVASTSNISIRSAQSTASTSSSFKATPGITRATTSRSVATSYASPATAAAAKASPATSRTPATSTTTRTSTRKPATSTIASAEQLCNSINSSPLTASPEVVYSTTPSRLTAPTASSAAKYANPFSALVGPNTPPNSTSSHRVSAPASSSVASKTSRGASEAQVTENAKSNGSVPSTRSSASAASALSRAQAVVESRHKASSLGTASRGVPAATRSSASSISSRASTTALPAASTSINKSRGVSASVDQSDKISPKRVASNPFMQIIKK